MKRRGALGISVQRVRALARAGRISAAKVGHRWVVERLSPGGHERRSGRPLSPHSAWAVLALISGFRPSWIDASSVSRLRRRLKNAEWTLRALKRSQARSKIERFRFLPCDLAKIRTERGLVLSGLSALTPDFNVVEAYDRIDAYVDARKLNIPAATISAGSKNSGCQCDAARAEPALDHGFSQGTGGRGRR